MYILNIEAFCRTFYDLFITTPSMYNLYCGGKAPFNAYIAIGRACILIIWFSGRRQSWTTRLNTYVEI